MDLATSYGFIDCSSTDGLNASTLTIYHLPFTEKNNNSIQIRVNDFGVIGFEVRLLLLHKIPLNYDE